MTPRASKRRNHRRAKAVGRQRRRQQRTQRKRAQRRRGLRCSRRPRRPQTKTAPLYLSALQRLVEKAFGALLHHKQRLSIFMIGYGILWSDRLGIAAVGTAMARAFATEPKHGIKQVDRYLSNDKLPLETLFGGYVPIVVGQRHTIGVNMDWTEFDKDDHSTLSLSLVTGAKRAIPLVWLTVEKSKLKKRQRGYERQILRMLKDVLPLGVTVIVLADRGFGDVLLYNYIQKKLGFEFVIRYRSNIYVEFLEELWHSADLVPRNGRIRILRDTHLTAREAGPYTVVLYKAAGMKDAWCLATSFNGDDGRRVVEWYSRRFQCEEAFRDLKDRRYGYGLRSSQIRDCERRDRFLFVFSLTYLIQTLMGLTSERLHFDKKLRANTSTERTHSLFRQGRALLGSVAKEVYAQLASMFRPTVKLMLSKGLPEVFA